MLFPKAVRFRPFRTSTAAEVIGEIAIMMCNANPNFRYQCPTADILSLLSNQVPPEVCVFVEDTKVRSGPQPDTEFIASFNARIFRDVIVSEVRWAAPNPDSNGLRFSDYSMIESDGERIWIASG